MITENVITLYWSSWNYTIITHGHTDDHYRMAASKQKYPSLTLVIPIEPDINFPDMPEWFVSAYQSGAVTIVPDAKYPEYGVFKINDKTGAILIKIDDKIAVMTRSQYEAMYCL
jgi:hypothetical protein